MSAPSCDDLKKHIIAHEILGVGQDSGGGGDLTINQGYPVFNDILRGNKTLSIARNTHMATRGGRSRNTYIGDRPSTATTGYRMPRNGTITVVSIENDRTNTFDLEIRRNGATVPIYSIAVTANTGAHDKLVNVDFNEGDYLQFYINNTSHNPVAWIEFAWRF